MPDATYDPLQTSRNQFYFGAFAMQNEKRRLKNLLLMLSLAALLVSCATPPKSLPAIADEDAKSFSVKDNVGTVYIYDIIAPIATRNFPVVVETQIAGNIGKGCYLVLDLKPGSYAFTSIGGAENPEFDLSIEAGHIYFLKLSQRWAWGSATGGGATYEQASADEGRKEVLKRNRVSSKFRQ